MSIIRPSKFKTKLRLSSEPSYSNNQIHQTIQSQPFPRKITNQRYKEDSTYQKQASHTLIHQYQPNFKPVVSQIVYIDTNRQTLKGNAEDKFTKKKRNFRQLKLELPKELIQSKHIKQEISRSLSKQSTDSVRIHKIRSNISVQAKKQYILNRQSFHPKKAYRYQDNDESAEIQISKRLLVSTMTVGEISSKKNEKLELQITDKIKEMKDQYQKLSYQIQQIVNKDDNENPFRRKLTGAKNKNKLTAVRILFRFVKKHDPRIAAWTQIQTFNQISPQQQQEY